MAAVSTKLKDLQTSIDTLNDTIIRLESKLTTIDTTVKAMKTSTDKIK